MVKPSMNIRDCLPLKVQRYPLEDERGVQQVHTDFYTVYVIKNLWRLILELQPVPNLSQGVCPG
jgi:hypothetical protein